MALPECLVDTYKRYKADTCRVAGWLAQTSEAYGYHVWNSKSDVAGEGKATIGRLKGKARKNAKANEKVSLITPPGLSL